MGANERRPVEFRAASEADGPTARVPRRWIRPPDIRATYPDPDEYDRPVPYGLTVDELRAEWRRRAAGDDADPVPWSRWELEARLLPAMAS